ncbi:hypothetical protein MCHI_001271 [Candidatus Magnetoovum chiemensis]|nr:hypothetical protein MCHI_001271 [Candidatus Magnetoovum chiemensis]
MNCLETKVKLLPNELQKEAEDFIDFLIEKKLKRAKKKFKLDWIGKLKHHRQQYNAVDLQTKAAHWRD